MSNKNINRTKKTTKKKSNILNNNDKKNTLDFNNSECFNEQKKLINITHNRQISLNIPANKLIENKEIYNVNKLENLSINFTQKFKDIETNNLVNSTCKNSRNLFFFSNNLKIDKNCCDLNKLQNNINNLNIETDTNLTYKNKTLLTMNSIISNKAVKSFEGRNFEKFLNKNINEKNKFENIINTSDSNNILDSFNKSFSINKIINLKSTSSKSNSSTNFFINNKNNSNLILTPNRTEDLSNKNNFYLELKNTNKLNSNNSFSNQSSCNLKNQSSNFFFNNEDFINDKYSHLNENFNKNEIKLNLNNFIKNKKKFQLKKNSTNNKNIDSSNIMNLCKVFKNSKIFNFENINDLFHNKDSSSELSINFILEKFGNEKTYNLLNLIKNSDNPTEILDDSEKIKVILGEDYKIGQKFLKNNISSKISVNNK